MADRMLCVFGPLAALLTSCASIVNGGPDTVTIHSMPPGAQVYVENEHVGTTPCTTVLKRTRSRYSVVLRKGGFPDSVRTITADFNGWAIGNVFFGLVGLAGLGIDAVSGNVWQFSDRWTFTLDGYVPESAPGPTMGDMRGPPGGSAVFGSDGKRRGD